VDRVSNLGGTFPRFFILKLVDTFTTATCVPPADPAAAAKTVAAGHSLITTSFSCAAGAEKDRCLKGGGTCEILRDGYYVTNILCVIVGTLTFVSYIRPVVRRLQALPLRAWRLSPSAVPLTNKEAETSDSRLD
jgi:MFS transporter, PAT family, solute carrier family 33 (acetyl-CoA transportor), member 1